MTKDPAFLFYSKDWLEGTAEYMPDEKGVYIDLLCHQHQKGSLPSDTVRLARMVGLSHDAFLKIWNVISVHFKQVDDRLVNRKLNQVMTERSEKGKLNTITGTFASLLRKRKYDPEEYKTLKHNFKPNDFISFPKEELTDRLSEWITERLSKCLKSIEDGNGNGNEDVIVIEDKEEKKVVGKKEEKPAVQIKDYIDQVIDAFCEEYNAFNKSKYVIISPGKERAAAGKLISIYKKELPGLDSGQMIEVLKKDFHAMVRVNDSWLQDGMSLSIIVNQFMRIKKIITNGNTKSSSSKDGSSVNDVLIRVANSLGVPSTIQ